MLIFKQNMFITFIYNNSEEILKKHYLCGSLITVVCCDVLSLMHTFESLGLRPDLVHTLHQLGFEQPTPIQEQAIPVLLSGKSDLIGLASTGTGKTAAFALPLLQHLDLQNPSVQGLVLCPTRELCLQVEKDVCRLAASMEDFRSVAVYGGASISGQLRQLRQQPQVVVATPGRLMDMMERKAVSLGALKFVILDEADEMLNMGFREDIDHILSHTPEQKRVWLFSATMSPSVKSIAERFMRDTKEVTVGARNATASRIEHLWVMVKESNKYEALRRFIDVEPEFFGIVFTQTRADAQDVASRLIQDGYSADALHGDLSQQARDKVMRAFRNRSLRILVATDVAARGIDVQDITHVVHYALPDDLESYTHRAGRTARAGKTGQSICLIRPGQQGRIRHIERITNCTFTKTEVPSQEEILGRRMESWLQQFLVETVANAVPAAILKQVDLALSDLSREELVHRMVAQALAKFTSSFQNIESAPSSRSERFRDDNDHQKEPRRRKQRESHSEEGPAAGFKIYYISAGKKDGVNPGNLLQFIEDEAGISRKHIGRIVLENEHSFIEVSQAVAKEFHKKTNEFMVGNRQLEVREANDSDVIRLEKGKPNMDKPRRFSDKAPDDRKKRNYSSRERSR